MIVTETVPAGKKSIRIYLDGGFAFWVYQRDFGKYPVLEYFRPGREIEETVLHEVYEEILFPRAKEAALCFLERSDRSEYEVRKKMKEKEFPEELLDRVIAYLYEYHYLDEERLIRSWLAGNAWKKSRRMIFQKLKEKGIPEETICHVMDEEEYEGNTAAVYALKKKLAKRTETEISWNEKQKVNAHLYRKGFTSEEIYQAWDNIRLK